MKNYGFLCGLESAIYYRTIGQYTTLYLEVEKDKLSQKNVYIFYKMRHVKNRKSYFNVYCEHVPFRVAIKRIESFVLFLESNKQ